MPCAQGMLGREREVVVGAPALIGQAVLKAVTSHGGDVLWCRITCPYMGGSGLFHFRGEVRFISLS